jgi:hypothetical protein
VSAIGDRVAIVSLGLSCQSSRQIDGHVPLLRELTGDAGLAKVSLPFDWLISTASGLTGMVADRCFFPETHTELCADQNRLRLRAHDILYWHESRLFARAGHPGFEDAKAKFRHTSSRFEQISKMDRVVAVISDTQSNLPMIEEQWNVRLIDTSLEQVEELRREFSNLVDRPVDLLMVSRTPRPDFPRRSDFAYYHMVPEAEGWAGNGREWGAVFKDYFSRDANQG